VAKYSFLIGEYTENEQTYHFSCRGKCYYISLKAKDQEEEESLYESTNMNEAYARWKEIKGKSGKGSGKVSYPGNHK
jgi:hypothetical protein